jgi:hypothetical protein
MRRYFGVDRILSTYDSTLASGKELLSRVSKGAYATEPWVFYGKASKEHHLMLTTCRLLFVCRCLASFSSLLLLERLLAARICAGEKPWVGVR